MKTLWFRGLDKKTREKCILSSTAKLKRTKCTLFSKK